MDLNPDRADYMLEMVVDLINDAFVLSDEGLFTRNPGKTKKKEITELIKEDKLLFAYTTPMKEGKLPSPVGSVVIDVNYEKESGTAQFGMMAVHHGHKKKGLAKMFVSECENMAKKAGCSAIKTSNLELAEKELPHKKFLNDFYTQKLGYQKDFEQDYSKMDLDPKVVPLIAGPIKYSEFIKKI
jgi:GNAT superfamily N-acetyltransferase